jgi:hypothetical protein
MRARASLLTAVACVAALSTASGAAAKPACDLVSDAKGDVNNKFQGVDAFPADEGLDVIAADLATNDKTVKAVFKLAAPAGSATLYAKRYIMVFTVSGTQNPIALAAAVTPTGNTFSGGYYGPTTTGTGYTYPSSVAATGSIDGSTVTISAPLADLSAVEQIGAIKKGAKVSGITATSFRRVPALTQVTGQVITADEATGKKTYAIGAPHCMKI